MISIFFLISLSFAISCTHKNFTFCSKYQTKPSWDYQVHVQTWAGNFCYSSCCDLPTSTMAIHTGFTMHGWWPEYYNGYPSCCKNEGYTVDDVTKIIKSDEDFKQDIAYYWPSLGKCRFFEYEYDKHGTCITDIYSGKTGPKDYANAAINFMKKYDFWQVLKASGVKADSTSNYEPDYIRKLICEEVGLDECVYFQCTGRFLKEMRICTNVTAETKDLPFAINCPEGVIEKNENCNKGIVFEKGSELSIGGCEY